MSNLALAKGGLPALVGYAIGTLRARWAHARQLRLLRADLRRVSEFRAKFGYTFQAPPDTDRIPRPASLSSAFVSTVGSVDFWITDEHSDDNSQEALLGVADGMAALSEIHSNGLAELDKARATEDQTKKRTHLQRLVEYAQEYDREVDYVQYIVRDSLRDLDRRLRIVRWWYQIPRILMPLRKGKNPPPLRRGDPRLMASEQEQVPRAGC